jgi:hypothetical protein
VARAAACTGGTTACGATTSVTYNGTALTFAGAATNGTVRTEIWYLTAPPAGSHNVVVTGPVATDITASSISFTGVNQSTPLGTLVSAIGTGTSASVTANTVLGEPVVDFLGAVGTTAPSVSGSTQTLRNTNSTSTGVNHVVSGNSTAFGQAASITMSWSIASADWAIAAVPIKASTALTGLDVGSFTATWREGGTFVQWRSGYQPGTVGFSVYRSAGGGPRTLLNKDVIPGNALAGSLSTFSWTDSSPGWNGDVSYWLAEVTGNGSLKWYGPASPVPPDEVPSVATASRDAGTDATSATGAGGFGGATPSVPVASGTGSPGEISSGAPQGGCTVASGHPLGTLRVMLLVGLACSWRRRDRRGWLWPAALLAALLASILGAAGTAGAAGGVTVDAKATATGASGLTFAHVMGSASNGLLVVGVVVPISCVDTTNDAGNCGACGTTCGLDTASLSSGLLGLWHLDEGTGTSSADSSGNGNPATLSGTSWTTGYEGNAVQGNGTSTYAQAQIGSWFGGNNALTAAAWVYVTANTNGPVFGVTSIPSGGGWNMPFLSIKGGASNATVYGWIYNNTQLTATVSLNAWHLLVLTYNPSTPITTLYVDGSSVGTTGGSYSASGYSDYWTTNIPGVKPTGVNSVLLGRVDEVRAYNRALSGAEVSALYTARLSCSTSTCAACGSGKTLCSGSCVTTSNDNNNCGSCGHACNTAAGETCSSGTCVCSNGALTDCSTICVDATTDPNNCGGCNNVCGMPTPTSVDNGLLARWKLDEGTGATAADATGHGRTATLTNSPTWQTGYSGYGLTFDGATNYANASLGTWYGSNNTLTASAWVYATSATNGPIFGVCSSPPASGWNMPFLSIAGSTVYGHIWGVNGNTPLSATVSLNAWHHLAITYDPSAGEKFYVDGALSSSGTGTFVPSGASDTWTTYLTGTRPSGVNTYLKGTIDDVRAYDRVLSATEIAIIYYARQSCSASTCGGCGGGESLCSGACTNKNVDTGNCGTCGTTCNTSGGETCISGTCGCATGTDCSGTCVDTTSDSRNCGGCGTTCGAISCTSCSQGLVGLWHLDEGTGSTSADSSGSGHTATLNNGPTWTTSGQTNDALTFSGTSYLTASLTSWFGGNNTMSASAWVYATSTTNGPIFGVTSAAGGCGWCMPFLSIAGSTVYGYLWQVNGNTPLSATVTLNAWHFLAITYDPSAGEKFYVDGSLSSSGTGTYVGSGLADYLTTYIPGATPSGVNARLTGTIDELRAYDRVLSAGEIKLLYDARASCTASSCSGSCPTGTTFCGGACTNTLADKNNCNGCGTVCPGAQTCVAGACM